MTSVHNVAAYILEREGKLSTWKMQKLIYWCQGWHLAWEDKPLFKARIEAWANGPVMPALYARHRGVFSVTEWPWGQADALSESERESVDAVVDSYSKHEPFALTELVRHEAPWSETRVGLDQFERGHRVIPTEAMREFYAALAESESAVFVDEMVYQP